MSYWNVQLSTTSRRNSIFTFGTTGDSNKQNCFFPRLLSSSFIWMEATSSSSSSSRRETMSADSMPRWSQQYGITSRHQSDSQAQPECQVTAGNRSHQSIQVIASMHHLLSCKAWHICHSSSENTLTFNIPQTAIGSWENGIRMCECQLLYNYKLYHLLQC